MKKGDSSMILKNRPITRHNPALQKITQGPERAVIGISHYDMVENVDFKKLACSDEVTGDFDVCLGWCRFAARMIVRDDDCGSARHNG